MPQRLFTGSEVCELARLQPYVLRSWEKEFPGIGVEQEDHSQRVYRQADVDQVLRIRQLVFGEGLTLSGARRRMESGDEAPARVERAGFLPLGPLDDEARKRIGAVREGLRSLLEMLEQQVHAPAPATSPSAAAGSRAEGAARREASGAGKPKRSRSRS
ncbi:MAG: MerR family transcriptional regulator [Acidimicrobiia bacterium]|nr:MerR family transcriptional regulator [Acidimicrobiia bacterium]